MLVSYSSKRELPPQSCQSSLIKEDASEITFTFLFCIAKMFRCSTEVHMNILPRKNTLYHIHNDINCIKEEKKGIAIKLKAQHLEVNHNVGYVGVNAQNKENSK